MQIVENNQADGAEALVMSAPFFDQTVERVSAPADDIVAAAQAASVITLNPAIRDRVNSGHREKAEDVIVLPCRRVALQGGEWRVDVQTL